MSPIYWMRDEIYFQFIKQLTNNPNFESVDKGLRVVSILSRYYSPSSEALEAILSFFKEKYPEQIWLISNLSLFYSHYKHLEKELSLESIALVEGRATLLCKE